MRIRCRETRRHCAGSTRPCPTSSFEFLRFKQLIEEVLGREVDLIDYGGLKPKVDDDLRGEAVLL